MKYAAHCRCIQVKVRYSSGWNSSASEGAPTRINCNWCRLTTSLQIHLASESFAQVNAIKVQVESSHKLLMTPTNSTINVIIWIVWVLSTKSLRSSVNILNAMLIISMSIFTRKRKNWIFLVITTGNKSGMGSECP